MEKRILALLLILLLVLSGCNSDFVTIADKGYYPVVPSEKNGSEENVEDETEITIQEEPAAESNTTPPPEEDIVLENLANGLRSIIEGHNMAYGVMVRPNDDNTISITAVIDAIVMGYVFVPIFDQLYQYSVAYCEKHDLKIGSFFITGTLYTKGIMTDTISWNSNDMETGFFSDTTEDIVIPDMSYTELLEYFEFDPSLTPTVIPPV